MAAFDDSSTKYSCKDCAGEADPGQLLFVPIVDLREDTEERELSIVANKHNRLR